MTVWYSRASSLMFSKFGTCGIFLFCVSAVSYSEDRFDHLPTKSRFLKIVLTILVVSAMSIFTRYRNFLDLKGQLLLRHGPCTAGPVEILCTQSKRYTTSTVQSCAFPQISSRSAVRQVGKDIYDHIFGRKVFVKSSMYEPLPGEKRNIVSVANTSHHAVMRRNLSHGFSAAPLMAQEDRVQHFVGLLIHQTDTHCCKHADDMTKWYNYTTFDIVGELAFGEAFGSLESGT